MLKRNISRIIILVSIFLYASNSRAQTYTHQQDLKWQIKTNSRKVKNNDAYFLSFPGAAYYPSHPLTPVFSVIIPVSIPGNATATLQNEVFIPETDPVILKELDYLSADIAVISSGIEIN